MSEPVQIALITGACIMAASAVPAWFAYQSSKTAKSTHKAVNSRLDMLLRIAEKSYHAEGVAEEKERQQHAATKKDQT